MKLILFVFCYLLKFAMSYSIPINYPLGRWIIKGTATELQINKNDIILYEKNTNIKMKTTFVSNEPLKLFLDSMEIHNYPKEVNRRVFTAIKWIYKIQKYGIYIEINDIDYDSKNVMWKIDNKVGECIISNYK